MTDAAPRRAYLTIDDSPSPAMGAMTDFLAAAHIPALFFCRGDRLAENPRQAIHAAARGMTLANHCYSHRRASLLSYEEAVGEIERTEELLEKIHQEAGVPRGARYFRFPHMDRGAGGWIVDYDAAPAYREELIALFADGLNIDLAPPPPELVEKKARLQDYLRRAGFVTPFSGVTHPWYARTEMAQAVDAMFTFSTSDWMVTARHKGKWPYRSLEDLKRKIDADKWLAARDSAHIILAHDQEEIGGVTLALVRHFMDRGFEFLPYGQERAPG
jgi:peptidoglycan/xylan/chitin deacetylase (PgdA/CDA1 family)